MLEEGNKLGLLRDCSIGDDHCICPSKKFRHHLIIARKSPVHSPIGHLCDEIAGLPAILSEEITNIQFEWIAETNIQLVNFSDFVFD
jgi:hypothetical protein